MSTDGQDQRVPDHVLTAAVRDGGAGAHAALAELYRRHRRAVARVARSCCRDPHTAEDLVSEAFARTMAAVLRGAGPQDSWRPYLSAVVRHTAARWSGAGPARAAGDLDGVGGPPPPAAPDPDDLVLRAFRALPVRWQTVLWLCVVQGEPAAGAAAVLGLTTSGVTSLAARARDGLREAYLAEHAAEQAGQECRGYSGALAAAVRRPGRRDRRLARHLAACRRCRDVLADLEDIGRRLRQVAPVTLPGWPGWPGWPGADGLVGAGAAQSGGLTGAVGAGTAVKVTGAVAAAAAVLSAVAVLATRGDGTGRAGAASPVPVSAPVRPPSSAAVASPSGPAPASVSPASAEPSRPPGGVALRLASTGRCMEIPAADPAAQPREAVCTGAARQRWVLVRPAAPAGQALIRNLGTGLCLRGSGTTVDGSAVTQAACRESDGGQLWHVYVNAGEARFADSTGAMMLGLVQWWAAEQGREHGPAIGTSHHYYGSPSFGFRFDGPLYG